MKTKFKVLTAVALTVAVSCSTDRDEIITENDAINAEITLLDQNPDQDLGPREAVQGEYIVIFKQDDDKSLKYTPKTRGGSPELSRIQDAFRAKALNTLSAVSKSATNVGYVYTGAIQGFQAKGLSAADVAAIEADERVAYVEVNYVQKPILPTAARKEGYKTIPAELTSLSSKSQNRDVALSNGEFLPWGVQYIGRRNNAGTNRYAFILDTGIAPHSDLTIDSGLSSSMFSNQSWEDRQGHGTHVAGTVGAKNNGSGVIGVAYGTTLVAVKVLDNNGSGSDATTIAGCDYAYNNSISGDVFNYSVGYRNRYTSTAVDNAFKRLDDKIYGALAAGNSNDDTRFYSPQRIRTGRTWMVGNLQRNLTPAASSCFGSSVDRWAPGTDVWSTWLNGGFNKISGTSMASPHVAGILAARGRNSVGTNGSATKGGYTASRAKL